MTLNEDQRKIADTLDGIIVVDAGPGTGKTHTIVRRCLNILNNDVDPSDVLMLTFTNNAADEMEERVKGEMISSGIGREGSVHSSTFDSFCLKVVMESPETASDFFKTKETLTRNAGIVQNETLNERYFRNVYTKFIRRYGRMFGSMPAVVGTSYTELYSVIQKLMSIGVAPTHDGGWFGRDTGVLYGNDGLLSSLSELTDEIDGSYKDTNELHPSRCADHVTLEMICEAVNDPRKELLFFVNAVYYEFIRSSIADNRLTFGLNALFAFIILYTNKHVRKIMSYRYVMVDEFQDTNELQFLISLLILKEPNLCAVGDWKQGIYGFRYATIENMTDFEKRLAEMKRFLNRGEKRIVPGIADPIRLHLTKNYRSSQLVIDTSFRSLRCRANNDEVVDEQWLDANVTKLTAAREYERTGIERLCAEDHDNEILAILQKIDEYVTDPKYRIAEFDKDGNVTERRPVHGDIAVLCRNGSMCIKVKEKADEYGIPAHLQGDVDIMATREGKLALAWLRYVNNRDDIRGPVAILSDAGYGLAELRKIFPEAHGTDGVPEEMKEQRKRLARKKRRINDLLTSIFDHHGLNNDITQSIITTLSSTHSGSMLTISDMIRLIETDMERSSKYSVDALLDGRSVMIQTMHKSKGLEYPIVIIGGLTTSVMPSTKNVTGLIEFDPLYGIRMTKEYTVTNGHHKVFDCWKWAIIKNIKEPDRDGERRLFFVALSRAKQYVTMTCHRGRESTFIKDVCTGTMTFVRPQLERKAQGCAEAAGGRPAVQPYTPRKKRISLHEVMGEYEESGGGKGAEHGIRVHKEAQRIMNGMSAGADDDETGYIKKIYDSLKGAEIMTEVDCSLPVNGTVIAGRIDMLAIFDDRVEVHDFKTDMNRSNEYRYEIQLSVYAHAAASLGKPVRCVIDYVSQGISITLEPMAIGDIYDRIASGAVK